MNNTELQDFLTYITGCPHVRGNKVYVDFVSQDNVAMTVSTCTNTLTLSSKICSYQPFAKGLCILIGSRKFTMP